LPHFRAGRFIRLRIQTADQPLVLRPFRLEAVGYPLRPKRRVRTSDPVLRQVARLCMTTLRAGAHDLISDSPYYEQLSYVGDVRLVGLVHHASGGDPALLRKHIELFAASATPGGLLRSRYPCRIPQTIPTFALLWIGMLRDDLEWQCDLAFIRRMTPTAWAIVDAFLRDVDPASGLVRSPEGWNFLDWCDDFQNGVPPGGACGEVSTAINLLLVIALNDLATMAEACGEPELRRRARRLARAIGTAVVRHCFDSATNLFAETPAGNRFSVHVQALAELARVSKTFDLLNVLDPPASLPATLSPVSLYFTHYVIEALTHRKRPAAGRRRVRKMIDRLIEPWRKLPAIGLRTTPERADPTRSDCHPWTAHVLYHMLRDRI
jgi:hypothetical protein